MQPFPEAAEPHEGVVAPDQGTVAHAHQGHGEGGTSAVGVAQGVGGGLDECLQLPAALNLSKIVQGKQNARGHQLRQRQVSVSRHQRRKGKGQHHDEVALHTRLQQPAQLPIHTSTSVIRVFLPIVIHDTLHYSILEGITQPILEKMWRTQASPSTQGVEGEVAEGRRGWQQALTECTTSGESAPRRGCRKGRPCAKVARIRPGAAFPEDCTP